MIHRGTIPAFVVSYGTADTQQMFCQLFLEPRGWKLFSGFYDFQANEMSGAISEYSAEASEYSEDVSQYWEIISIVWETSSQYWETIA
jgi:hypothetical protein